VPFHGAVKKLSLDEARKFAGIGLQDEFKRGEVQRLTADLKTQAEAQKQKLDVGEAITALARANPRNGDAMDLVYTALREGRTTPEQVMAALQGGGGGSSESNGTAVPNSPSADAQTRAELQALRQELQGVKSEVTSSKAEREATNFATKIDSALAADPFTKAQPEPVKRIIRDRLSPHLADGLSIAEAVALEVNTFKDALAAIQTAERDKLRVQAQLGSPPPSAGMPPVTAPDFSKIPKTASPTERRRAMLSATIDRAKEAMASAARAAVSGPSQ
jgi:hypothetical protein